MTRQLGLFDHRSETGAAALVSMLLTRRPHGTKTERLFINDWISPLGTTADGYGNHLLRIGNAPILWSCHTDTVHKHGGRQKLRRAGKSGIVLDPSSGSNCLGADDTVGVWLMREMILAKVPGLYVFHREEEIGCKGSGWIVKHSPDTLKGIKFAVAFDRKGYDEVITHQGSRTCSDEFATSFAAQLGMDYKPSDRGVYTDTREYTDLVGECSNIGVGYFNQHTKSEWVDAGHLLALREKLLVLNAEALVTKRLPGEVDKSRWMSSYDCYEGWGYEGGAYGGGSSRSFSSYNADEWHWKLTTSGRVWGKCADGDEYEQWDREAMKMVKHIYKAPAVAKRGMVNGVYTTLKDGDVYKEWDYTEQAMVEKTYQTPASTATTPATTNGTGRALTTTPQTKPHGVTKIYYGNGHNHGGTRHESQPREQHTAHTTRAGEADEDDKPTLFRGHGNPADVLERLCRNHPEAIATLLEAYGIDADEVADHVYEELGHVYF